MTKKQAIKTLMDVKEHLEKSPDSVLVSWSAIYNDTEHYGIRGDLLFLNIVQIEDGEVIFRRIRPATINKRGETGGPELLYSIRNLIRIDNGRRKGQVHPRGRLDKNEIYVPSGLRKRLEYDMRPDSFHIKRKGDIASLELMNSLVWSRTSFTKKDAAVPISSIAPALRLVCREGQECLYVRRDEPTERWLQKNEALPNEEADDTGRRIAHTYAQPAGEGWVSYPFEHYYGRGVIAADVLSKRMTMGVWYKVDTLESSLPGIVFKCKL